MFSEELEKYDWDEITARISAKTDADVRHALEKENLTPDDFMALISPAAVPYLEQMARLSMKYTQERFGKTISMYIPLYLSNACTNFCVYCGFNHNNEIKRTTLTPEQIEAECKAIRRLGPFENLLIVTGEHPAIAGVDYLENALRIARPYFNNKIDLSCSVNCASFFNIKRILSCFSINDKYFLCILGENRQKSHV